MGKEIFEILDDDDDKEDVVVPKKKRKMVVYSDEENDPNPDVVELSSESEAADSENDEAEDNDGDEEMIETDDELSDSGSSESVSEYSEDSDMSWEDVFMEDGDLGLTPEVEEESLRKRFSEAMKELTSGRGQTGFEMLCSLLQEPLLQKYKVQDFDSFNWESAKGKYYRSCEPRLKTIAYSVNRMMARYCVQPIGFYIQALAMRPTNKALWYEFGCSAAQLHDWKLAEMAFRECEQDPDAVMKLAIVYFYSEQYHKCLPLIKELLAKRSSNLAARILKAEIIKVGDFWKHFAALYFPSNPLFTPDETISPNVYEAIMQKIQAVVLSKPPPVQYEGEIQVGVAKTEPIKITLEKSLDDFAKLLCNHFDKSCRYQLPLLARVHFIKERRHSHRHLNSSLTASIKEEIVESASFSLTDCDSLDVELVVSDVLEVVEDLVARVAAGRIPKLKSKKKSPKKIVRRSLRRIEDIPLECLDSPSTYLPTGTNFEPLTIRSLIGLQEGECSFAPLEFPGTSGIHLDSTNPPINEGAPLDTFDKYLQMLLSGGSINLEKALFSFLSFIASSLTGGCVLTDNQRLLYLEVYVRWVETYCQPFHTSYQDMTIKEIAVHLLALELDSANNLRSKELCQKIFENVVGFGRYNDGDKFIESELLIEEDTSIAGMRRKAVRLLEETDPVLAKTVNDSLANLKGTRKRLHKSVNVVNAARNLSFTIDAYRPRVLINREQKKDEAAAVESVDETVVDGVEESADIFDHLRLLVVWMGHLADSKTSEEAMVTVGINLDPLIDICSDIVKIAQKKANSFAGWSDEMLRAVAGTTKTSRELSVLVKGFLSLVKENCVNHSTVDFDVLTQLLKRADELAERIARLPENEPLDEFELKDCALFKRFHIRYLWLQYARTEDEGLRNQLLLSLLKLFKTDKVIYTQLSESGGEYRVITLKLIVDKFINSFNKEQHSHIMRLYEDKEYDEVITEFTTNFAWKSCKEQELVSNLKILLDCFVCINDRKQGVQWICRMLDKVIDGRVKEHRDQIYVDCLNQLNDLDLESIDHESLNLIAKRLVVLAEYKRFKWNLTLWKILYRVVTILEDDYPDDDSRLEMYYEIEGYKLIMPTKALCILAEGHRVLGEERCCKKNDGEFMYFIIDEIYKCFNKNRFDKSMMDYAVVRTIQRNVEIQLLQCLRCLFDASIGRSVVNDHGDSVGAKATLDVARKVIPFLVPKLPMFDDERFATNDIIDAINKIFPFIEEQFVEGLDEAVVRFDTFVQNPPQFYFKIDNHELIPEGDFESALDWPSISVTDETRQNLEVIAFFRYIFLVLRYKKADNGQRMRLAAKQCLAIAGSLSRNILPAPVLHSLWAVYAYGYFDQLTKKDDDELLKSISSCTFLFKLAFLLYPKAFSLHVDSAGMYYQLNAYLKRLIRNLRDKKLPTELAEDIVKRENMVAQCKVHLETFKYNISQTKEFPADISWIEAYFSGKIAEHEGESLTHVLDHYHRCACLMREEEYTYPLRVQKGKQENFEPLEIHYRVHVYALKTILKLDDEKFSEDVLSQVRIIRNYLRLFKGHFVFAKKPIPLPPIDNALSFIDSNPVGDFEDRSVLRQNEDDDEIEMLECSDVFAVRAAVNSVVEYTDMKIECVELCRRAFETIVKRFPHYKSYYRLSFLCLSEQKYQAGLDVLFSKLYRGKFTSFDEVQDIVRTDFERLGTIDYHVKKIIYLAMGLTSLCKDIGKLLLILEDLAKADKWEKVTLLPEEQSKYIRHCVAILHSFVDRLPKETDQNKIERILKAIDRAIHVLTHNKRPEIENAKPLAEKVRKYLEARSIVQQRLEQNRKAAFLKKQEEDKNKAEESRKRKLNEMMQASDAKKKADDMNLLRIQEIIIAEQRKNRLEELGVQNLQELTLAENKRKAEGHRQQQMRELVRQHEMKKAAEDELKKKRSLEKAQQEEPRRRVEEPLSLDEVTRLRWTKMVQDDDRRRMAEEDRTAPAVPMSIEEQAKAGWVRMMLDTEKKRVEEDERLKKDQMKKKAEELNILRLRQQREDDERKKQLKLEEERIMKQQKLQMARQSQFQQQQQNQVTNALEAPLRKNQQDQLRQQELDKNEQDRKTFLLQAASRLPGMNANIYQSLCLLNASDLEACMKRYADPEKRRVEDERLKKDQMKKKAEELNILRLRQQREDDERKKQLKLEEERKRKQQEMQMTQQSQFQQTQMTNTALLRKNLEDQLRQQELDKNEQDRKTFLLQAVSRLPGMNDNIYQSLRLVSASDLEAFMKKYAERNKDTLKNFNNPNR